MGKQWKQWQTIFMGSKITTDGDCSHEIKRRLLLGRKVMTNLDSILKSRDITLSTKVHLVKAMVFNSGHVWMWELDYKETECRRIDAFELWCWRRTLESPLDVRECLTGGFLCAVSPKFSVPYQFLFRERVELHAALRTEIMRNVLCLDSFQ